MIWKCVHCGHEAAAEESCCWEHWQEAAHKRDNFAVILGFSAVIVAAVVCAILLTLRAGGG